jgi:2-polyprenyl-3-methyl-5-hydroxy-6-metoxy-1,4-benzoquinol methylase
MAFRDRVVASVRRRRSGGARRVRPSGAVEALRDTWSRYPGEWKNDASLNLGFTTLGEEWGGPAFADGIVELVAPHLGPQVDVLELGCGGGKFSQRLAPRSRSLLCTDISSTMIEHTRASLEEQNLSGNVSYRLLNGVDFDGVANDSVDFIFSYDVLLHVQMQNVFSYLVDARRVLRENGVLMLHQINLASEGGMAHFLSQFVGDTWKRDFDDPRRRGHVYFMSADQMRALADQAGLSCDRVVSGQGSSDGLVADRDLIGLLQKKRSRLSAADRDSVRLLKAEGHSMVYAVIDERRLAFVSTNQFERAGFRWDHVRELSEEEITAIPDGGPLEPWE